MDIILLKSVEIDGQSYGAGQTLKIEGDDDYCNDLIKQGVAKLADPTRTVTKFHDIETDPALHPALPAGTLTLEAAEKLVAQAVKAALDAERKNVVKRPNVQITSTADDPSAGYKSPADFFMDVAMHYGSRIGARQGKSHLPKPTKRLEEWNRKTVGSDEYREISDPAGGFLLPQALLNELLKIPIEQDFIGSRTRKIRMQTRVVEIPKRVDETHTSSVSGGLVLTWTEETAAITPSQQSFKRLKLELHKLTGAAYVTEEMLVDSPMSVVDILTSGFQDEYTKVLMRARLYGNGAGQPLGIMNSGALVSVAKETGQAATTLQAENVIKMYSRCWGYDNAIWLGNHNIIPQLLTMYIATGTGGQLVYQPSLVEGRPASLLGRPIFFSEHAKTLGTTGDLILSTWGEYADGVSSGIQASSSAHVRFLNDEQTFKFTFRADGRPLWDLPLTPAEASDTLSPFVVLDTRA